MRFSSLNHSSRTPLSPLSPLSLALLLLIGSVGQSSRDSVFSSQRIPSSVGNGLVFRLRTPQDHMVDETSPPARIRPVATRPSSPIRRVSVQGQVEDTPPPPPSSLPVVTNTNRYRGSPRSRGRLRTTATTTTTTTTTTPATDDYYEYDDYYDEYDYQLTTTTTTTTTTERPMKRRRGRRRFRRPTEPPTTTTTTTLSPNYKPRPDGRIIDYSVDPNFPYELKGSDLTEYPFFITIPESSFSCRGRHDGYYADIDLRCQVYHHCAVGHQRYDFLCPNYTLFDQTTFTCRFINTVDCLSSENHYKRNDDLYVTTTTTTPTTVPTTPTLI